MDQLIQIRASAMPRAVLCPGSVRRGRLLIDATSEPADLGSAAHEAFRPLAEGVAIEWDSLPGIADRWNVSAEELRMLVALARKLWDRVKDSFKDALTEVPLSTAIAPGVELTGHADLVSISGRAARIGDWKTGRKDSDYSHQMRAYAALALRDNPDLEEATATILWVRDGEIENYTMTRADAEAWLHAVRQRVVEWDGVYRTGSHCSYCPRLHECEASTAMARRDAATLLDVDAVTAIASMDPERVVELYQKVLLVEQCAERVREAVRVRASADGPITANGFAIGLEPEERRSLDVLKAWPVLEAQDFTDEDYAACIEIRPAKLDKVVAQKAGRGKGAAAVRALTERLEQADAVKKNTVQKLVVRRKAG